MTSGLRWYQEKTIYEIKQAIRSGHRRILVVLPTGSGKSHVQSAIAQGAVQKGNRVLSLVHRRQLVEQLKGHYERDGIDTGIIMAGHESELIKPSQVASMLTYNRRLQLADIGINKFFIDAPVILIDESQHCLSKAYQTILENYSDKIVIGFTATPVIGTMKQEIAMGQFFEDLICPVSVQEMIDGGYLVPGEYWGPPAPDGLDSIKDVAGDYHVGQLNSLMSQPKIIGDAVQNWLKISPKSKTMVFCVKVSHSKAVRDAYLRAGISAEHLDAHSPDDVREQAIARFKSGETQIITQVSLYTEGTDIPEIETIQVLRPTRARGLWLQILGRGARPHPGKGFFTVIDHGGCIAKLGLYEDERFWALEGKKVIEKKPSDKKKEKKPISCCECDFVFKGSLKCPRCGTVQPDRGKPIETADADLVKVSGKKKATTEEKRRFYRMLKFHIHTKGYKSGWAYHKFKERYGVSPRHYENEPPLQPDYEFERYIKHLAIKYAMSQRKSMDRQDHEFFRVHR